MGRSRTRTVLAVALALACGSTGCTRPEAGPREVEFAGRTWWVKDSAGRRVGPGPNVFSASEDNVWVDGSGRLHLAITTDGSAASCAEIVSAEPVGYGRLAWQLDPIDGPLPESVVLGMFTWSDRPAEHHQEIDIELGFFGMPGHPGAQFTVQPGNRDALASTFSPDVFRGETPAGQTSDKPPALFALEWGEDHVAFEAGRLGDERSHRFRVDGDSPAADGSARARINLWMFRGAPGPGERVEVVFTDFRFLPAD